VPVVSRVGLKKSRPKQARLLLVRNAPYQCSAKPQLFERWGLKLAQRIVPGLNGGQTLAPAVTGQIDGAVDQRMA